MPGGVIEVSKCTGNRPIRKAPPAENRSHTPHDRAISDSNIHVGLKDVAPKDLGPEVDRSRRESSSQGPTAATAAAGRSRSTTDCCMARYVLPIGESAAVVHARRRRSSNFIHGIRGR